MSGISGRPDVCFGASVWPVPIPGRLSQWRPFIIFRFVLRKTNTVSTATHTQKKTSFLCESPLDRRSHTRTHTWWHVVKKMRAHLCVGDVCDARAPIGYYYIIVVHNLQCRLDARRNMCTRHASSPVIRNWKWQTDPYTGDRGRARVPWWMGVLRNCFFMHLSHI